MTNFFKCNQCGRKFADKDKFVIHTRRHRGEKAYQCRFCDKWYINTSNRNKHEQAIHMKVEPYRCTECDFTSRNSSTLTRHVRRLHGTKDSIVMQCIPRSNWKEDYNVRNKDLSKQFQCDKCGQLFGWISQLNAHQQQTFESGNSYKCDKCGQRFSVHYKLDIHLRVHAGERPFPCRFCDASFTWFNSRHSHENAVHKRARVFECEYCDKKMFDRTNYRAHIRTHIGVRPYKCRFCAKTYINPSHCTSHERSVHAKVKNYRCKLCGYAAHQSSNLMTHIKGVHFGLKVGDQLPKDKDPKIYLERVSQKDNVETEEGNKQNVKSTDTFQQENAEQIDEVVTEYSSNQTIKPNFSENVNVKYFAMPTQQNNVVNIEDYTTNLFQSNFEKNVNKYSMNQNQKINLYYIGEIVSEYFTQPVLPNFIDNANEYSTFSIQQYNFANEYTMNQIQYNLEENLSEYSAYPNQQNLNNCSNVDAIQQALLEANIDEYCTNQIQPNFEESVSLTEYSIYPVEPIFNGNYSTVSIPQANFENIHEQQYSSYLIQPSSLEQYYEHLNQCGYFEENTQNNDHHQIPYPIKQQGLEFLSGK